MDHYKYRAGVFDALRAHAITRLGKDLALAVCGYARAAGFAWPSHATLAARVGCCERSVRRTLAELRDVGLLDWRPRWVRDGRVRRLPNLYRLALPEELQPRVRRHTGLRVRGVERQGSRTVAQQLAALGIPKVAQEQAARALAEVRRARTDALNRLWMQKRSAEVGQE